ncbi:hypothetical protein [Nocardia sp. XZ_19_385]|uniref:hypothetical protein n=1 Tax=Nocardia sp. XZ_19_385 TaxID=2769488 RepID=UPI001890B173|nr:hypothetical protein [Nocardia sp. XZ_19_385]
MSKTRPVHTVDRTEYERLQHTGLAGSVDAIQVPAVLEHWREVYPEWSGQHWAYTADDHDILYLHPLEVTRRRSS